MVTGKLILMKTGICYNGPAVCFNRRNPTTAPGIRQQADWYPAPPLAGGHKAVTPCPGVAERSWLSGCNKHYKFVLGEGAKVEE